MKDKHTRVRLVPLPTRILMLSGMVEVLIKKVSEPKFEEIPIMGRGSRFAFKQTVLGRIFGKLISLLLGRI